MLETPLYGRFLGENKKLVFQPTGPYFALVRICVVGGFAVACGAFFASMAGLDLPIGDSWWFFTGLAVGLAGVLGAYSLQIMVFDLRELTYKRRQGSGFPPSTTRGKLSDLDAIVLIAEPNARLLNGGVTYHLILHWKGGREAPMVLQHETRALRPGEPMGAGGAYLMQLGMKYASAIGVAFYDNSHFPSNNPVHFLARSR